MTNTISTFAELADLMEPEWNLEAWTDSPSGNEWKVVLTRDPNAACAAWGWTFLRGIEGTFKRFTGTALGDTQTIHIELDQ